MIDPRPDHYAGTTLAHEKGNTMTEFTITKAEVEALIREIEAPAVINRLIEEFGGVYEGWRRLQRPYNAQPNRV